MAGSTLMTGCWQLINILYNILITVDTAKFVMFSAAVFQQLDLEPRVLEFFFLLLLVNETFTQPEHIYGILI